MSKQSLIDDPAQILLSARPGYLVRRLNQIHASLFFEECKEFNVTPVQYGMLTAISALPGMDQTALGFELGLDRTNTADVLRRLEERGLVMREVSKQDGRVRNAFTTKEGEKIIKTMYPAMLRAQERLLEPLNEAENKKFMQLLHKILEGNNEYGRASMRAP
ncbi:MAG TPA: MarR family transcriptional regulator [Herbaspirillum sp.]|jgi:DNA-binding MarR family transcriptional regulator